MKESKKTEKKENQKEKNDIRIIKNVIGISLVFIFLSSILLTGFFALKDMNSSNIKKINNTLERPNFGSGNMPSIPGGSSNIPNDGSRPERPDTDEDDEKDYKEESDDENTNEKGKKKNRKSSSSIDDIKDNFEVKEVKISKGVHLLYVILLMFESLFLGASIMFLIYANIK